MRAKAGVQATSRDREQIIVTEIPYQVNKAQLLEQIGELVREKTLRDFDIRDGQINEYELLSKLYGMALVM